MSEETTSDFVKMNEEYLKEIGQAQPIDVARAQNQVLGEEAQQVIQADLVGAGENDAGRVLTDAVVQSKPAFGAPIGFTDEELVNQAQGFSISSPFAPDLTNLSANTASTAGDTYSAQIQDYFTPQPDVQPSTPGITPTNVNEVLTGTTVSRPGVKTGEDHGLLPSAELDAVKAGQARQQELLKQSDKILQSTIATEQALDIAARPLDEARIEAAREYGNQVRQNQIEATVAYQKARDEVQAIRTEMANQDWSSYWGGKDTGDKLLLGLSIALGAYSQATIGGQNIGLTLVNQMMEDHDNTRKAKYQSLKGRLDSTSADSLNILEGAQRLDKLAEAHKLADLDQISKQYDLIANRAKSAKTITDAQNANIGVKLEIENKQAQINSTLAAKSTYVRDVLSSPTNKQLDPSSGFAVGPDGKETPMNATQSEVNSYALLQARNYGDLEGFEDRGMHLRKKYALAYDVVVNASKGVPGQLLDAINARTRIGSELDRTVMGDQELKLYMLSLFDIAQLQTRKETGATLGKSEIGSNFQLIAPTPLRLSVTEKESNVSREFANAKRQAWVDTNLMEAGNPSIPKWRQGAK